MGKNGNLGDLYISYLMIEMRFLSFVWIYGIWEIYAEIEGPNQLNYYSLHS